MPGATLEGVLCQHRIMPDGRVRDSDRLLSANSRQSLIQKTFCAFLARNMS